MIIKKLFLIFFIFISSLSRAMDIKDLEGHEQETHNVKSELNGIFSSKTEEILAEARVENQRAKAEIQRLDEILRQLDQRFGAKEGLGKLKKDYTQSKEPACHQCLAGYKLEQGDLIIRPWGSTDIDVGLVNEVSPSGFCYYTSLKDNWRSDKEVSLIKENEVKIIGCSRKEGFAIPQIKPNLHDIYLAVKKLIDWSTNSKEIGETLGVIFKLYPEVGLKNKYGQRILIEVLKQRRSNVCDIVINDFPELLNFVWPDGSVLALMAVKYTNSFAIKSILKKDPGQLTIPNYGNETAIDFIKDFNHPARNYEYEHWDVHRTRDDSLSVKDDLIVPEKRIMIEYIQSEAPYLLTSETLKLSKPVCSETVPR